MTSFQDDFLDTEDSFMGEKDVPKYGNHYAFNENDFNKDINCLTSYYSPFVQKSRNNLLENQRKL